MGASQGQHAVIERVEIKSRRRHPEELGQQIVDRIISLNPQGEKESLIVDQLIEQLGMINGLRETTGTIEYRKIVDSETYMKAIRTPGTTLNERGEAILPPGYFVAS